MTSTQDRQNWMGLLARAPAEALRAQVQGWGEIPGFDWLRAPEIGTAMVRGRQGGTGGPFNLGEISVTRCSLRLAGGEVGHAYVRGRDKAHAELAAVVDALMQTPAADSLREGVLAPLQQAEEARKTARAAKAAATKVEFFTMVRGEG